ncbi:MAG: sensor histidine kinase, partial [Deltaproteobacteria bacterium]
ARLGRRGVKRVPVSLATLFAEVRRTFAERIEAAGGTIEIPAGLPVISTDPTLLRQILVNLIENALAYRRREVALRLEIGYKREGGEIRLSLSDNGLGIPPEFREKVFELFHRLHNASEVPGTGIGLALVKRGVELLGGRVWFDSTPDVGTTFHVALPALDGEKDSLMGRLR